MTTTKTILSTTITIAAADKTGASASFLAFDPDAYIPRRTPWEKNAGVIHWRAPPFDATPDLLAFSPDVVPLTRHPEVTKRDGAVAAVLEAHLARFTEFTEHLEVQAVIPACLALRVGASPIGVPAMLARDAGKAAIDELAHADAAEALRRNGASGFGLPRMPSFLEDFERSIAGLDARGRALARLIFPIVTETLITGTLLRVPRDERVRKDVRETLREHAREEAYHHALFGQLIGVMWPQLADADRDMLGPLFARYIAIFLAADLDAETADLVEIGFDRGLARRIALEATEDGRTRVSMREAAAPTLRFLERYGVLAHDPTRLALEAEGFLS
jgi:hypothetical protein